jgi:hypothetical protein
MTLGYQAKQYCKMGVTGVLTEVVQNSNDRAVLKHRCWIKPIPAKRAYESPKKPRSGESVGNWQVQRWD